MDLASFAARIDWPATALLAAVVLAALSWLWRRGRRKNAAPLPVPALAPATAPDMSAEMRELRRTIQDDLELLRGDVAALRDEVAILKASRPISPQYSEAITLAGRGLSAEQIADRCGISVGEAELVRALGRKPGG
jgi:DNA-directed RNA polymerase specialized sigma24 family protein